MSLLLRSVLVKKLKLCLSEIQPSLMVGRSGSGLTETRTELPDADEGTGPELSQVGMKHIRMFVAIFYSEHKGFSLWQQFHLQYQNFRTEECVKVSGLIRTLLDLHREATDEAAEPSSGDKEFFRASSGNNCRNLRLGMMWWGTMWGQFSPLPLYLIYFLFLSTFQNFFFFCLFYFLSHKHFCEQKVSACVVVLRQNTALIKHSAAENYLHLFKLLFMPFVWRVSPGLKVWTSSQTVIISFRKWNVCVPYLFL